MSITHPELVKALVKPGADILSGLTERQAELWHMSSCIAGEAGELFDAVKKNVIYQKPLNYENIVEELGDLEFYMEGVRQILSIEREECLRHNIAKLSVRYSQLKYTDQAAQERADKNVTTA